MAGNKFNQNKVTSKSKKPPVTNKVEVDTKHPIPFGNDISYSLVNSSEYIPFLNTTKKPDQFATDLLEARILSNTNNACISTKKRIIAGDGFYDVNGKEFDPRILEWFDNMNLRGESVVEINEAIFEDFFTYGNNPIEIIRFSVMKEKRLFIYVHDFREWRLVRPGDDDICTHAIQSKLFLRTGYRMDKESFKTARKLPIYNPLQPKKKNWLRDEKGVERTLIWYKNRFTGFPHYGLPSNIASLITQLLEYKGDRYDLDNFENNLVAAAVVALKGNISSPEASRIGRQINNTYVGDGKRGRTIVVASEEGIDGSDVHQLNTEKDGSYLTAGDRWMQKIILANEWDAILAGIISPSTLGKGANFITKIYEIKLKSVILPEQRKLLKKVWKHIFKIAEEWLGLPFSKYDIAFKNTVDISGLTDVDITPAVQINEVRKAKGLPEDPKKIGEYMKSAGPAPEAKKKEGDDVPEK